MKNEFRIDKINGDVAFNEELHLYWNTRNKSTLYSKKLNKLFTEALVLVSKFPVSPITSQIDNVRLKLVGDYQIIYEITETEIIVHYIWDSRQNPRNFPIE